jgi:hypothetical protein
MEKGEEVCARWIVATDAAPNMAGIRTVYRDPSFANAVHGMLREFAANPGKYGYSKATAQNLRKRMGEDPTGPGNDRPAR